MCIQNLKEELKMSDKSFKKYFNEKKLYIVVSTE